MGNPHFERPPSCGRDPDAADLDRLGADLDYLMPCCCEAGADETCQHPISAKSQPCGRHRRSLTPSNSANTPSISRKHFLATVPVSIGCSAALNEALIGAGDQDVLRWFILVVACLLDPAAVVLLLAATRLL